MDVSNAYLEELVYWTIYLKMTDNEELVPTILLR